jgi:hypothetical protein
MTLNNYRAVAAIAGMLRTWNCRNSSGRGGSAGRSCTQRHVARAGAAADLRDAGAARRYVLRTPDVRERRDNERHHERSDI